MESYVLLAIAIYPIVINSLGAVFPRLKLSSLLFLGPLAIFLLTLSTISYGAPIELHLWSFSTYLSIGLKLDALSGFIGTTVLTIGMVVMRYSVRHLEDDSKKDIFFKNLAYTLSCVLTMLMSSNLVLFFASWVGVSYFLHLLLTHFSNRTGAQRAANHKFWVSRLGDMFMIVSGALLFWIFNSLDFDTIFLQIQNKDFVVQNNLSLQLACLFLVLGALTKSAQFPFHYWLPNTMETPAPVSAIMHAGIINGGGYLVIRMSPLLSTAPLSLSVLTLIGGFTAFYGSIIMLTQSNVKKSLAYSTISQMGFMMLQCGLGAFSIAVVHIIGHAFYKAYAFLSSGTTTDYGRLNRYFPTQEENQNIWTPFITAAISILLVFGVQVGLGYSFIDKPGISILLVVLSLAVAQIFLGSRHKLQATLTISSIVGSYLFLSSGMNYLLTDIAPDQSLSFDLVNLITFLISIGFFVALYLIQNNLEGISRTRLGKRLYVSALSSGLK